MDCCNFGCNISFLNNLLFKQIANEIREREEASIKKYGKFLEYIASPNQSDEINTFVEDILIENKTIPVIVTNEKFEIIEYKNLNKKVGKDSLYLKSMLEKMKNSYNPIIVNINNNGKEQTRQLIFYKNSYVLDLIIIAPYFLTIFLILILILVYQVFYYSKKSENDRLFTGLAKETAHQLGTPLTSLIGWNEYIKSKNKIPSKSLSKEIEKDLNRLKIITERFSSIGSKPNLTLGYLNEEIKSSINYLKFRTSRKIKTTLDLEKVKFRYNEQLFSWVIENLYKNSIDSLEENGEIIIKLKNNRDKIIIDFIDNGKGLNRNDYNKIFNAGFTTKKRGWGLGLTLAKRIIEDYHKGKIYVLRSIKNIETVIRIELNI